LLKKFIVPETPDLDETPDLEFVIAAIKGIDEKISINNNISHKEIISKNKEIIEEINSRNSGENVKSWEERKTCQNLVCTDEECPEDECPSEVPSILSFLNSIDGEESIVREQHGNKYLQWDGTKYTYIANQDEDAPILDTNTLKIHKYAKQVQKKVMLGSKGLRQSTLNQYLINPNVPNIPEVSYRIDIWNEGNQVKRCFYCAKRKNTPGWSSTTNNILSNSSVPVNSRILYTVITLNKQTGRFSDLVIKWDQNEVPFCFCQTHWREVMIKGGLFNDNINSYNVNPTSRKINEMATVYNSKVEALDNWMKQEQERRLQEDRIGYQLLFSSVTGPREVSGENRTTQQQQRQQELVVKSDDEPDGIDYARQQQQQQQRQQELAVKSDDEPDGIDYAQQQQQQQQQQQAMEMDDGAPSVMVMTRLPFERTSSTRGSFRRGNQGSLQRLQNMAGKYEGKPNERSFRRPKSPPDSEDSSNEDEVSSMSSYDDDSMSGGGKRKKKTRRRRKKKTKRRRKKKKKTRRKNKRKKKTKRRRKKKKKTRRRR